MKRLTLMMVLMLAAVYASGQSRQSTWSITPRVGLNSSDVRGLRWYLYDGVEKKITKDTPTRDQSTDRKWGLTAGFDVEGLVSRRFGISAGAYFSDEGYKSDESGAGSVHLRHISVPVLANYYVLPGLAVKTGVHLSALIDGQIHYDGGTQGVLNDTKTFSVSIPVGASYDYRNVSLDVRYMVGITDFCDNKAINSVGHHWYTNSVWITLGYRFDLFQ